MQSARLIHSPTSRRMAWPGLIDMHSSKSIPEMPGNASVSDAAVRGLRFVRPPIGMPDVRG